MAHRCWHSPGEWSREPTVHRPRSLPQFIRSEVVVLRVVSRILGVRSLLWTQPVLLEIEGLGVEYWMAGDVVDHRVVLFAADAGRCDLVDLAHALQASL